MTTILKVRDLTIRLSVGKRVYPVVENLNFDLKEGKTLALVGESGCGKSMTALAIVGILPTPPALPPEGEIFYKGENLLTVSSARMRQVRGRKIGMIFQDPLSALNPVYTIGDQLLEVTETHLDLKGDSGITSVLKALDDVQLSNPRELMKAFPHQLSGGMLQRVMIAMALICEPDVLIADEPTTALDVTIQAQILKLLRDLQLKKGMATLLITHDMGVVAENADEVIVMYAGEQIEQGPVESLFDNPSHPYSQALYAARPDQNTRKRKLSSISGFVPRLGELPTGCRFHPRCDYAMDMCKKKKVPSFALKEQEHFTRCWLYDQDLDTKLGHEDDFAR